MVIHAVPGTVCCQNVAVVVARTGTVTLVYEHTIQSISMLVNGVIRGNSTTIAYIRLNIEHLREHNVTSYLAAHHSVPA